MKYNWKTLFLPLLGAIAIAVQYIFGVHLTQQYLTSTGTHATDIVSMLLIIFGIFKNHKVSVSTVMQAAKEIAPVVNDVKAIVQESKPVVKDIEAGMSAQTPLVTQAPAQLAPTTNETPTTPAQ